MIVILCLYPPDDDAYGWSFSLAECDNNDDEVFFCVELSMMSMNHKWSRMDGATPNTWKNKSSFIGFVWHFCDQWAWMILLERFLVPNSHWIIFTLNFPRTEYFRGLQLQNVCLFLRTISRARKIWNTTIKKPFWDYTCFEVFIFTLQVILVCRMKCLNFALY